MFAPRRGLPAIVAGALLAVALLGYLAGRGSRPVGAGPDAWAHAHVISVGSALVEYPSGWHAGDAPPAIPGAPLGDAVVLSPARGAPAGGVLAGALAGGGPAPLPADLLARLHARPSTEVVALPGFQAYRYNGLGVELAGGGQLELTELYVIPNSGTAPTALGCLAVAPGAAVQRECEQIVARASLVGQTQYSLIPDARYARRLGALIARLDRERLALRGTIGRAATAAAIGPPARVLASRFAAAAAFLAALEAPLPAAAAEEALTASLRGAHDAYAQLAGAALGEGEATVAAASTQVARAEAAVEVALENFSLLGYASATPAGVR